jgi:quercetin dioxygenase-like cupin family protein
MQQRTIDPTWLRRSLQDAKGVRTDLSTDSCRYRALFGEGDADDRILRSATRFGEVEIAAHGECQAVTYADKEELYFVSTGQGSLSYGAAKHALRASDFTYVAPGVTHALKNDSDGSLRVIVMTFKVPGAAQKAAANTVLRVINLKDLKEETVGGHPNSVLYKLMVGPRGATRDAIDDGYVVTSLFLMDFAPGGTNFPHHHETAEEIYLVLDGKGEMAAGSGQDGIVARFPAKAGDAYYFRPNCTVGFYNDDRPGATAHILAVRARMPLPKDDD